MVVATFLLCPKNKCQQSVNYFWPCILEYAWAVQRRYSIIALSAAFLGKNLCNSIAIMSYKYVSTESQQLLALYRGESYGFPATLCHDQITGYHSRRKQLR